MKITINTQERTLALDPATATGFAYRTLDDGIVYGCERFERGGWRSIVRDAYESGARNAIVEDAFLGPNPKVYGMLKAIQGELLAELRTLGFSRIVLVAPYEWKTYLFGTRTSGKKLSVELASEYLNVARVNHNAADAVCMLLYSERVEIFSRS